jgi:chromosome segregation ATPase
MKTKGIKMDDELFDRFASMYESFKEAGLAHTETVFMEKLLDEIDKSNLANKMDYGSSLKELNQTLSRVSDIFINLAKQNETDKIFVERQHQADMETKESNIEKLKGQYGDLKEKFDLQTLSFKELKENSQKQEEAFQELKKRVEEQSKTIESQDEHLKNKDQTISNQAIKIDSMTRAISQNEELLLSVNQLKEEITNLHQKYETEKKEQAFEFEKQLFEKEKELQQIFQERIEKIQDEMNDRYEERLASILNSHDERVGKLNQELTQLKVENLQKSQRETHLEQKVSSLEKEKVALIVQLEDKKNF